MLSQRCNTFIHFNLLGPYYVLEDRIGYCRSNSCELKPHPGEVAVITGGNRGIGASITKDLLSMDMTVIIGCRKIEEGTKFVESLKEKGIKTDKVTVLELDLASLKSVKKFAESVIQVTSTINLLINNAGINPSTYKETEDKFEYAWQVNYLGHVLLINLLLPVLQSTPGTTKVVSVSSLEHKAISEMDYANINKKENYDGNTAYARAKLAQIMFSLYLDDRLRSISSNVEMVVAHPGIVNTEAYNDTPLKYVPIIPKLFFKSPQQGATTIVYAALFGQGGQYLGNCAVQTPSSLARNKAEQQKLITETNKALQISMV